MSARACLAAVPLSSQFRAAFARRLSCSTRADFPVPTPLRQQSANAAVSLEENFYSKFLKSFEKIRIIQCFWQFDEQFIFGDQKVRFPIQRQKLTRQMEASQTLFTILNFSRIFQTLSRKKIVLSYDVLGCFSALQPQNANVIKRHFIRELKNCKYESRLRL